MTLIEIKPEDVETTYKILQKDATEGGYHLNPDAEFTKNLVARLMKNEKRYGYRACPCRLASGKKEQDLDIIRSYAVGCDRKIQDLRQPIEGYTNPEWRSNDLESSEMHEQRFC